MWGQWDQNVIEQVTPWYILCFSYQWFGQKTVHAVALPDFPEYVVDREDDSALLTKLAGLLDEADVVVGHNADRFDIRKVNARLAINDMPAPSTYQTIDTLKVARRHFAFNSNRLDDLGQVLNVGRKASHTGFGLWKGCMQGDPASWTVMKKYAKQDIRLLVAVYERLRPWMRSHPSLNMLAGESSHCPTCNAEPVNLKRRGFQYSKVNIYQRWQCHACGSYCRSRISKLVINDPLRPDRVN